MPGTLGPADFSVSERKNKMALDNQGHELETG